MQINAPRLLVTIAGFITILAIIATPASANFEANGNTSQGPYTISGQIIFTNAVSFVCATLERGQWHIQKTDTKQEPTKQGGRQEITGQLTKCTVEIGVKSNFKVNAACALGIKQTGPSSFIGLVTTSCSIKRGSCIITIPAGPPNSELKAVEVVNITTGNEETSNVVGITNTVNKACEELGFSSNKEGSLKGNGIATGQKIV
jgi:hypothetical protein